MPVAKLNKTFIDSIKYGGRPVLYHDAEMPGFGVRVGQSARTYFAQGAIKGRTVRVTIGRHGLYTPDEARKKARELLVSFSNGIDPNTTNLL